MIKTDHGCRVITFAGTPEFGAGPSALIFHHLPKCAGTTFRHQLVSRFESFYDASFLESWARDHLAIRQSTVKRLAIAGHAALGMHELLPPQYRAYYITVLREPYARALSEYRFLRNWYCPIPPLADYLRRIQPNFLVHRLGNGDFDLAMERLSSFYYLFGITERFDDFLAHLGSVTNLDFSIYTSRNCSSAGNEEPAGPIRDEFIEHNALDIQLYEAARILFDDRVRGMAFSSIPPQQAATKAPDEYIHTLPEITRLIDDRRFSEAALLVDAIVPGDAAEKLQLLISSSKLHLSAGHITEAVARANAATQINTECALVEASILRSSNVVAERSVLVSALNHFRSIVSTQPDSQLNCFRESVRSELMATEKAFIASRAWHRDTRAYLHGRWIIKRLAALVMASLTKPVRVALYGNGSHTEWLLALLQQLPLPIQVTIILDDNADPSSPEVRQGTISVCRPDPELPPDCDCIILSSDSAEHMLRQRCDEVFNGLITVHSLYEGSPLSPGPYAKVDPGLPRISLVTMASPIGRAANVFWQAQVQAQCYPNLEHVIAVASGCTAPPDELLPWEIQVPIPNTVNYGDAVRMVLGKATGEWVCLASPEDSLKPLAYHAMAQQHLSHDVLLGVTSLTQSGVTVDLLPPGCLSRDALHEWWHRGDSPPSANAMFFRRRALMQTMAVLPTDLSAAALRYELLMRVSSGLG